jgi:hypothetical protein
VFTGTPSEELLDLVRRARAAGRRPAVLAGMTGAELDAVELQTNTLLPFAVRELFGIAAGFSIEGFTVDFRSKRSIDVEAFPNALPIAADRNGTWIMEHDEGGWYVVIYVSYRPAVIVIQASTLSTFIAQVFEPGGPRRLVEPILVDIKRRDPYAVPRRSLMTSRDPILLRFAQELDDNYFVTDLREQRAGVGFAWLPDALLKRAGGTLVFAASRRRRFWPRLSLPCFFMNRSRCQSSST